MAFGRSWLFSIQHFPCSVSFWCVLGGNVGVWTKNTLYRFVEGQTHLGMSRGAKMSLAPNVLRYNLYTSPSMHWKPTKHGKYLLQNNQPATKTLVQSQVTLLHANLQWKIVGDQGPTRCSMELKDNSIGVCSVIFNKTWMHMHSENLHLFLFTSSFLGFISGYLQWGRMCWPSAMEGM